MRKLTALLRAFAIVIVAIFPGIGAVFTLTAADRMRTPTEATAPHRVALVGTYEAATGDLQLAFRPVLNAPAAP